MSYSYVDSSFLTGGVMSRRCVAFVFDALLIAGLLVPIGFILTMFGVLTLGMGFGALGILPFIPFLYHFLSLLGASSATPGQQMMGLTVRRDFDLGLPGAPQAAASVLTFYLTLATSGLLLVLALFTIRHRTLHDMVSGLVVVRAGAFRTLTGTDGRWNMPPGTSAP